MLIRVFMLLFPKFLLVIYFGQIWSQNLRFSKLTSIWCSGTLLYPYYDFNLYFFHNFLNHKIWINVVQKSDVVQIDWNLAFVYIWSYMLIVIEGSNFSKFNVLPPCFLKINKITLWYAVSFRFTLFSPN